MTAERSQEYKAWIEDRLAAGTRPLNKCEEWTIEMQAAFPELQRVRGYVFLSAGYERPHWWLIDEDGAVVDPTHKQWVDGSYYPPGTVVLSYEPLDEEYEAAHPVQGKCMSCGELSRYLSWACSKKCAIELDAYYNCKIRNAESQP